MKSVPRKLVPRSAKTTSTLQELLQRDEQNVVAKVESAKEILPLRAIPVLEPFIQTPEMILETLYIYEYEGIRRVATAIRIPDVDEILELYNTNDLRYVAQVITDRYNSRSGNTIPVERFLDEITKQSVAAITELAEKADPTNPISLLFLHRSQDTFRSIWNVEKELIKDEPEVSEHATEQCRKCGSKRIRVVAKQLRGADEPTDQFAHCSQCRVQWRITS